jgi:hypothetical protein
MNDNQPLYNSRITRTYLQYLRKNFPDINLDALLEKAGIAKYEIEDPGHWFSQEQVDRFHESLIIETGDARYCQKSRPLCGIL